MDNPLTGQMPSHKTMHAFPCPTVTTSLAASTYHLQPQTSYLVHESTNTTTVVWDGLIIQPPLYHTSQPPGSFAQWPVHAFVQLNFDRLKSGAYAFGNGVAVYRERPIFPPLGTLVCESKEVEGFGPSLPSPAPTFARITTELDQTGFAFVQFQTKLGKACPKFLQTHSRFRLILKTDHEVIRITYDYHVSLAAAFAPPLYP